MSPKGTAAIKTLKIAFTFLTLIAIVGWVVAQATMPSYTDGLVQYAQECVREGRRKCVDQGSNNVSPHCHMYSTGINVMRRYTRATTTATTEAPNSSPPRESYSASPPFRVRSELPPNPRPSPDQSSEPTAPQPSSPKSEEPAPRTPEAGAPIPIATPNTTDAIPIAQPAQQASSTPEANPIAQPAPLKTPLGKTSLGHTLGSTCKCSDSVDRNINAGTACAANLCPVCAKETNLCDENNNHKHDTTDDEDGRLHAKQREDASAAVKVRSPEFLARKAAMKEAAGRAEAEAESRAHRLTPSTGVQVGESIKPFRFPDWDGRDGSPGILPH